MASGLVGPPLGMGMVKQELVHAGLPLPPHARAPLPAGLPPHADPAAHAARLEAYKKVMRCFMQGPYDLTKEDALASLRSVLAISEHEHLTVRAAAMADAHHHVQLHPAAGGAGSGEVSVGHSSQPAAHQRLGVAGLPGSGGNTPPDAPLAATQPGSRNAGSSGAAAKRPAPSTASKAGAAAPRKRTRTAPQGATAGAGTARGGPAVRAPRATAANVDPLVGRVVLRNWPHDGGFFRGVVSDYRSATQEHCIIYDMGKPTESYEWYSILSASAQDCQVTDERVDFATLSLPAGSRGAAAAAAAAAPQQPPAAAPPRAARPSSSVPVSANGVPLRGAAAASAAAKQQRAAVGPSKEPGGRQGASKAGASRAAVAARPAAKPATPRSASAAAVAAAASVKPPAAAASRQQQAAAAAPAPAPAPVLQQQQQQPARNGKTHHAHLANGLSSHAAAVKQVLAAGGRPPYLNGHTLLPRRTRSWSSDEDDSDDSDDE
ncbi:EMSY-LIKE 3 [Micractinium conductrix]|uniref:EMSY-LIKE 3 n=1 Tax=Micractinium conductrix TaxID=554055 RepID=A0A2P6V7D1_9CHLO|nr:EMSY-LIKE 3 [Micractinium conductrix]|eukprot:PSC69990.1 EMSY-LIKE 3 [Micractinium conductrix]